MGQVKSNAGISENSGPRRPVLQISTDRVGAPEMTDGGESAHFVKRLLSKSSPASSSVSPSQLAFAGGPIVPSPELVSLFWGPFSGAEMASMLKWLSGFVEFLSGAYTPTGHEQVLEQYGVSGASLGVLYHDPVLPTSPVGWPEVGAHIESLQAVGNLPPFSGRRLFLVFTKGLFAGHAAAGWCALHGGAPNAYIAIIPYPEEDGCGSQSPVPSWQIMTAHEIMETATDPQGGRGWTAGGPDTEGADLCSWLEAKLPFGSVQMFADNLQQACSVWTVLEVGHLSAASWAADRLDTFLRGADGDVHHKWWDGSGLSGVVGWGPSSAAWHSIGGGGHKLVGTPIVTSWGSNRLDVFARTLNGAIYHKSWDGSAWGPSVASWDNLGGRMAGNPTCVSWGPDRLDVFARGLDGAVYHKAWNGTEWQPSSSGWQDLGGIFAGSPAAVSWGPDRLDVFARGLDGAVYHKAWNGAEWQPSTVGWQNLGGQMAGSPTCVSWGPDRLDVFARGLDGAVYHKAWNGTEWQPSTVGWQNLGGKIVGDPSVASWGAGRLDIAVRGLDAAVYHKAWNGAEWQPSVSGWQSLGGDVVGTPSIVSWGRDRLDIFTQGADASVYHKTWDGNEWQPSVSGWQSLGGHVA